MIIAINVVKSVSKFRLNSHASYSVLQDLILIWFPCDHFIVDIFMCGSFNKITLWNVLVILGLAGCPGEVFIYEMGAHLIGDHFFFGLPVINCHSKFLFWHAKTWDDKQGVMSYASLISHCNRFQFKWFLLI